MTDQESPIREFRAAVLLMLLLLPAIWTQALAARPIEMQTDTLTVAALGLEVPVTEDGAWTTYAGLPSVGGGVEAADGSLWFAAEDRVLRFDPLASSGQGGESWTEYMGDGGPGLVDGSLESVALSPDGTLWFAGVHDSTAAAVQFQGGRWIRYSHPGDVTDACGIAGAGAAVDSQGRFWMAAEHYDAPGIDTVDRGRGVLRFSGGEWERFDASDGLVHNIAFDIAADASGGVVIGGFTGVSFYEGEGFTNLSTRLKAHDVAIAADGAIWCNHGYPRGGITILRDGTQQYIGEAEGLPVIVMRRMAAAHDGVVWLGTDPVHYEMLGTTGILRGDGRSWLRIDQREGLPGTNGGIRLVTAEGVVWMQVPGAGLVSYRLDVAVLGTISGRVVQVMKEAPASGAGVHASDAKGIVRAGATVGDDGLFHMQVFAGTYEVRAGEGMRAIPVQATVLAGETVGDLDLVFDPISKFAMWIGVAVVVGAPLGIVVGAMIWWRRRRRHAHGVVAGPADPELYPGVGQGVWLLVLLVVVIGVLGAPFTISSMRAGAGPIGNPVAAGAVTLAGFAFILWLGLRRTGAPWREVFPLTPVRSGLIAPMAATLVGGSILLSDLNNLMQLVLPIPPELGRIFTELAGGKQGLGGSALLLVIVAPLTEEFLFRGLILRGFLRRYSVRKAILVSAILFGAIHLNPWQAVGAIALGVLFGWWFVRTRSLLPCIFGHALNNAIPVLMLGVLGLQVKGLTNDPGQVTFQPLWLDMVGVVLAGGGLWWTMKEMKNR